MDFDFINELIKELHGTNIFKYSFTGVKALAMGFLLMRFLDNYVKDFDSIDPKTGNILSLLGYGLIIMGADWIMASIDSIFASVESGMRLTGKDDILKELEEKIRLFLDKQMINTEDWMDKISVVLTNIPVFIGGSIALLLGYLFKIADMAMTVGFLIQRVFLLEFMKFIFPLMIAFATSIQFQNLFYKWVKGYIGMYILGIAYIGIISLVFIIQDKLLEEFKNMDMIAGSAIFGFGLVITIVTVFGVKARLFSSVTSYVMSFFT